MLASVHRLEEEGEVVWEEGELVGEEGVGKRLEEKVGEEKVQIEKLTLDW